MHHQQKDVLLLITFLLAVTWHQTVFSQTVSGSFSLNNRVENATLGGTPEFEMTWFTIDNGGGASNDTEFVVQGTFGQPDPIVMIGEDFTLRGGFWAIPDFTNIDFVIFKDGFESELFTEIEE